MLVRISLVALLLASAVVSPKSYAISPAAKIFQIAGSPPLAAIAVNTLSPSNAKHTKFRGQAQLQLADSGPLALVTKLTIKKREGIYAFKSTGSGLPKFKGKITTTGEPESVHAVALTLTRGTSDHVKVTTAASVIVTPNPSFPPAMKFPRAGHTATLLPNGQVLLIGGEVRVAGIGTTNNTAERYDLTTNTFTALTATMTTAREEHTATLLPNGQVLLTGGFNNNSSDLNTAELYDAAANTFTALTATMTSPRSSHTATLLPNGKVLITGGDFHSGNQLNTAEVYDPGANTFTALTATMTTARTGHTATLLPNGKVLITGGAIGGGKHGAPLSMFNTAELYDPATGTFTALTATMTTARAFHTATLLPNGTVLITGGGRGSSKRNFTVFKTAELYDPTANTFSALTATMTTARFFHTATLLPNGRVLLTGGGSDLTGPALDTAELW